MPAVHVAATLPINPPGAQPVLSRAQVWAGLRRKVRHAEEFVPIITGCDVVSDEDGVVTRKVSFEGREDPVTEVCTELPPCRVDFAMEDGSRVQNIVGEGEGGELYMTYAFVWQVAGVEEGSEGLKEAEARHQKVSRDYIPSIPLTRA